MINILPFLNIFSYNLISFVINAILYILKILNVRSHIILAIWTGSIYRAAVNCPTMEEMYRLK